MKDRIALLLVALLFATSNYFAIKGLDEYYLPTFNTLVFVALVIDNFRLRKKLKQLGNK